MNSTDATKPSTPDVDVFPESSGNHLRNALMILNAIDARQADHGSLAISPRARGHHDAMTSDLAALRSRIERALVQVERPE